LLLNAGKTASTLDAPTAWEARVSNSLIARVLPIGGALLVLFATGCANTYDTLTSRRFRDKPMQTLFTSEDPMHVLRNVPEGDDRIRAMRALKEPKRHGGTDAQQDEVIQILARTATEDPAGLCRLAAVDALSRFEDPRVPQLLVTAYRNAPMDEPASIANAPAGNGVEQAGFRRRQAMFNTASFAPEVVTAIQCRSLEALAQTGSPAGLALLCDVAGTPAKPASLAKESGESLPPMGDGIDHEKVRVAAVRALGQFHGNRQALQVLLSILKHEKDVVLRSRAHESLIQVTGQRLPPNAEAWETWLQQGAPPTQAETGLIERVGAWFAN
jgi:hypothetical protein